MTTPLLRKTLSTADLAEIATRLICEFRSTEDGEPDPAYETLLRDVASIVTQYCGADYIAAFPSSEPSAGWMVVVERNDAVPPDGGVWETYDAENSFVLPLTEAQMVEQESVIQSGSGIAQYLFALNTPSADVERLQEAVIESGNPDAQYHFLRDIPGADTERLAQCILSGNDWSAKDRLAQHFPALFESGARVAFGGSANSSSDADVPADAETDTVPASNVMFTRIRSK